MEKTAYARPRFSRLFQNIREKQGLAYAVFSELNPYRDTGCLSVYAGTSAEAALKVVELVMKEFRDLQANAVPPEELRRAKDHLKGSLMLGLENTASRMSHLARQEKHQTKPQQRRQQPDNRRDLRPEHLERPDRRMV